ncbi:MAG: hypothetical protein AB7P07_13170 [Hyphomonadaceae bacterium]
MSTSAFTTPTDARARVQDAPGAHQLTDWNPARTRDQLQRHIYGRLPDLSCLALTDVTPLGDVGARLVVEVWRFRVEAGGTDLDLAALMVRPSQAPTHTVLFAQCFRPHLGSLDGWTRALRGERTRPSLTGRVREIILGRHIHTPPFERVAAAGVGLFLFYPADLVPDHRQACRPILEALSGAEASTERGGVLAHWAAITIALRGQLAAHFPNAAHVAWGHSRHGKAALLAAAFDPGFDAVIAHQSGRYGAAMTDGARGETVAQIVRAFPHWFCERMSVEQGRGCEVDQQHLLALLAPRPILLSGARADFWADHAGAVRAGQSAAQILGAGGLTAYPDTSGAVVSFERPGWHGVTGEDWRCFLDFLGAKFRRAISAGDKASAATGQA